MNRAICVALGIIGCVAVGSAIIGTVAGALPGIPGSMIATALVGVVFLALSAGLKALAGLRRQ